APPAGAEAALAAARATWSASAKLSCTAGPGKPVPSAHRVPWETPHRVGEGARGRIPRASAARVARTPFASHPRGSAGGASPLARRGREHALYIVRRQPEHLSGGSGITRRPKGRVGDGQHSVPLPDVDLHLGVHTRPEQAILVVDPNQDREDGNVLLGLSLWLDLEDGALERAVGKRVHGDGGALSGFDCADVGLCVQRLYL